MIVQMVALLSSSTSLFTFVAPPSRVIDALDESIRTELQRSSEWYFAGVIVSAIVVAIGVAMEGPEIFHELWPNLFSWFTWSSLDKLRRFERRIKIAGLVGWLLVVVGVAGEGVFELVQNRAEGQLQTFNSVLLRDARLTATTAKDAASDAANASTRSRVEAEKAIAASDTAQRKLGNIGRELSSAETKVAALNSEITRVNAAISWRTVTPQQKAAAQKILSGSWKLLPLQGLKIHMSVIANCNECDEYADELKDTLDGFGAEITLGPLVGSGEGITRNGKKVPMDGALLVNQSSVSDLAPTLVLRALLAAGAKVVPIADSTISKGTVTLMLLQKPHEAP